MDGEELSLSSFSSSSLSPAAAAMGKSDSGPPQSRQGPKSTGGLWMEDVSPVGERLLSGEQVTLITESMTVTSSDQEKLLLLNKNTELRRVNKELMKLNEEWDQVYRSATLGLQHRLEALELENSTIKQLNNRLLLKVEYEQAAKEYYEQSLIQELKKNQDLQEYIRVLEGRVRHADRDRTPAKQGSLNAAVHSSVPCPTGDAPGGPTPSSSHNSAYSPPSCLFPPPSNSETGLHGKCQSSGAALGALGDPQQELQDLKEQLEALRYQTQIYEAEFQTEHKDHKHTLQENRRLRKKREDTRQQVALLQEQLKVYEDDFRRERSDKQILQRLLLKKTAPNKDPVLIHRCNNEQQPLGGDNRTDSGERVYPQQQRKQHHPLCPKHSRGQEESA